MTRFLPAPHGLLVPDRDEVESGRLRRYYRLTDAGAAALRAESERMAAAIRLAEERLARRAPRLGTAG
ncbi:MAG TPA: hypothetical protein VEK80_15075 [Kribbellaceae bacterium]|nr:hypothetical protein [Kribbellaceae bacterium]